MEREVSSSPSPSFEVLSMPAPPLAGRRPVLSDKEAKAKGSDARSRKSARSTRAPSNNASLATLTSNSDASTRGSTRGAVPCGRLGPGGAPSLCFARLGAQLGAPKKLGSSPTVNERTPLPLNSPFRRSHKVGRSTRAGPRGYSDCPLSCSLMSLACLLLLRPPLTSF